MYNTQTGMLRIVIREKRAPDCPDQATDTQDCASRILPSKGLLIGIRHGNLQGNSSLQNLKFNLLVIHILYKGVIRKHYTTIIFKLQRRPFLVR